MTTIGEQICQPEGSPDDFQADLEREERTMKINKLQKKHPGTRRQRSSHGAGKHSVQFFDRVTGKLVADYNL